MKSEQSPKEMQKVNINRFTQLLLIVVLSLLVTACRAAAQSPTPTARSQMPGMNMENDTDTHPTPTPMNMPGMESGKAAEQAGGMGLMQEEAVPSEGVLPATENEGGQLLPFTLDGEIKTFELTARPVLWNINADTRVTAWSYNGTVPGPMIRVTEGDKMRVVFKNELPDPTSIHWHGLLVPSNMDGVSQPELSQPPVLPGDTFVYEFEAKPAGTFMYHSHYDTDTQINVGLFGGFVVEPKEWSAEKPDQDITLILNEWRVINGVTFPAMPTMSEPNFFTINGKTYPDIPAINVKLGERVRIRFIGAGQFEHPMHLHGMPFKIVATDGYPVPEAAQLTKDVIPVHPGERFDIEFVADNPGQWAFHCHIVHHATNDDVEPGGLLFVVNVTE